MVFVTFKFAMILENLIRLGFTESEAKVYLMLLRIGPSPVSALAQRIGMKRVTVYSVLDSLSTRGLVTFEQFGNCRRYIPHDPECLLFGLEKQNAELKYRMGLAKSCIETMYRSIADESLTGKRICFFNGVDTVFDALKSRIDEKSSLFVMFPGFRGSDVVAKRLEKFLVARGNGKGSLRICVPADYENLAKNVFTGAVCRGTSLSTSTNANLIVQKDRVFFVLLDRDEVQMIYFDNASYAKFFCEMLLPPSFAGL